jgi:PBSX family phage terminase large subunit
LECPVCGALQLTYNPQDYQELFHEAPFNINEDGTYKLQTIGIFGGYGSAKSKASVHEFFLRALECPKSVGLVTAPTLPLLKKTTWKLLLDEVIPPPLIDSINKQEMTITLTNGYVIWGIPSDDEEKLRSINAAHCHMEEASGIKRTIYDQILARLRHPLGWNRAFFICSNPDLGWIKEVIVENEARRSPLHPEHEDYDPDILCFIWATSLNKYLPADFLAKITKNKPTWWINRFTRGSFDHAEGAVYVNAISTFIEDNDELIQPHFERIIGGDFGRRNPTAVLTGAIDPVEGIVYIYDEYYVAGKVVPEHAAALKPKFELIPTGLLRYMKGDPSMANKQTSDGKSVMGLYQEYGIFWQPGNNKMEAGLMKVNSYIERGKLKIFARCINTKREMIGYKYPELSMDDDENLDENPEKKHDHAMDALRYMMMELPDDPDMLRTIGSRPGTMEDFNRLHSEEDMFDYREYQKLNYLDVGY